MNNKIITLILFYLILVSLLCAVKTGNLAGRITDEKGKPVPFANIHLDKTKIGTQSGRDGSYLIKNIPVGKYDVICANISYQLKKVTGIVITIDETTKLDIVLIPMSIETEGVRVIESNKSTEKIIAGEEEDRKAIASEERKIEQAESTKSKDKKKVETNIPEFSTGDESESKSIEIIETIEATKLTPRDDGDYSPDADYKPAERKRRNIDHPGLKAGYVDDNKQYNYFLSFLEKYEGEVAHLPLAVEERIIFNVLDSKEKLLPNTGVEIFAEGELLEEGLSYADGSYLFFPSKYDQELSQFDVSVTYEQTEEYFAVERNGKRNLDLVFPDLQRFIPQNIPLDILFIFDTTGSMKEEIKKLKDTIELINLNLTAISPKPDIRFGMVLYKDITDSYITKQIPFTADLDQFQTELNKVKACGGGDTPEDLQSALQVSMLEMEWRDDGIKLGFIITDAPPHLDYKQDYTYEDAVYHAKQKGIKLFSIGTGGLNITGEYILRQISQYTNAGYVFLTYGEKGDSEGGKPGSVSHHVGANYETDKLEAIIIQLVKKELNFYLDKPVTTDEYIAAIQIKGEDKGETLDKLFALAISQLVDYSSIGLSKGIPAVISPILQAGSDKNELTEYLTTNLMYAFSMNETFQAIERDDIPVVLDELKLQLDDLFDLDKAADLGEFIGAKMIILGKLYTKSDNYELFLKLLNVETAEVLSITKTVIDKELGI